MGEVFVAIFCTVVGGIAGYIIGHANATDTAQPQQKKQQGGK